MLSILGKLLCSELGENNYDNYFRHYSRYVKDISGSDAQISRDNNSTLKQNEEIFYDIYKQLRCKDIYTLQGMLERLLAAIELTMRISRQYRWVWLATVATIIILIVCPISGLLTFVGVFTVVTGFGYKSIVFIVNRYCFIDANIVLLYKTALYHIILTYTAAGVTQC